MKRDEIKLLVRTANVEDIESIQKLVTACDVDEFGTAEYAINIAEVFQAIPIGSNTWIVYSEENKIVGHAFMEEMGEGRLDTYVFTHPEYRGLGIGSLLVEHTEKRAVEYVKKYKKKNIPYEFNNIIPAENLDAKVILEERGYKFKRMYSQMSIELINEPEDAIIPENIAIKNYTEDSAAAIYEAYCEAFQDARSHRPKPFDVWMQERTREGHDFSLWYLAYEKEKLVGFLIGKSEENCIWVDLLGVSRDSRKKGIGKSLLQLIMKESYDRGIYTLALNVDADSPTNAHELYKRVGMKPVFQIAMYEKNIGI
jgi:GNAT superfamily N-acetyltransferase